jgi:hypothetical protein
MLTIPGHKGNAIKTTLRFRLLPIRMRTSRTSPTINVDEDAGKKEPSYTAGGSVN